MTKSFICIRKKSVKLLKESLTGKYRESYFSSTRMLTEYKFHIQLRSLLREICIKTIQDNKYVNYTIISGHILAVKRMHE